MTLEVRVITRRNGVMDLTGYELRESRTLCGFFCAVGCIGIEPMKIDFTVSFWTQVVDILAKSLSHPAFIFFLWNRI